MEEPKTLSYDWQYGREELFLRVDSYMSDDNLYTYGRWIPGKLCRPYGKPAFCSAGRYQ